MTPAGWRSLTVALSPCVMQALEALAMLSVRRGEAEDEVDDE
jgi:hypothetical protein